MAILLITTIVRFVQIYTVLLIVRVLLTWFQTADWANRAMSFLSPITDPYLNIFRSFIPPLGGMDFSPILAILLLQWVGSALAQLAFSAVY
ncbi:MAG: YggT family protein [Prochloron sp. SP5CPC1]|nr:YggT family protein [Candidatus Paraprochloron terpiosi SP5CPC1]